MKNPENNTKTDLIKENEILHKKVKELEKTEEQFRLITENTSDVISLQTFDMKASYTYVSPSIKAMSGYEPEEMLGRSAFEFIHPDDKKKLFPLLKKYVNIKLKKLITGKELPLNETIEFRVKDKSGNWRYAQSTGNIVGDQLLFVSRDITERKQAEEELAKHRDHLEYLIKERTKELEKSQNSLTFLLTDVNDINEQLRKTNIKLNSTNKELEAFSYSVSHDLRAPLIRMDGFSKELIDSYSNRLDDQGIHFLNRIRASSQHMAKLIDDLLSLSRITRGKVSRQKVDLSQITGKITEGLKAFEPGRKVNFNIAKGLSANADMKFVEIVLENLLGNAFKFTGKNKNAIIEFGKKIIDEDEVFFIKDNGSGFNMKYYDKIYTAFQRLHSDKDFKGTGIGLAIVQRIINKHGGNIWAESEEDKGTTFYFRFE